MTGMFSERGMSGRRSSRRHSSKGSRFSQTSFFGPARAAALAATLAFVQNLTLWHSLQEFPATMETGERWTAIAGKVLRRIRLSYPNGEEECVRASGPAQLLSDGILDAAGSKEDSKAVCGSIQRAQGSPAHERRAGLSRLSVVVTRSQHCSHLMPWGSPGHLTAFRSPVNISPSHQRRSIARGINCLPRAGADSSGG
jgi:hypothetical protein